MKKKKEEEKKKEEKKETERWNTQKYNNRYMELILRSNRTTETTTFLD